MSTSSDPASQTFRELFLELPDLEFSMDVSSMSLPRDVFERHATDVAAAMSAMRALEAGAVANPDEKRRVGHYWLRDSSLAPDAADRDAIDRARGRVVEFAARVHAGKLGPEKGGSFERVVLVGIGGSALGPQLVADALTRGPAGDPMRLFFVDNTDPDGIDRVISRLGGPEGLARTLTVVVSKSGGTKETRNGMVEMERAYRSAGLSFARHAVAITSADSELDRHARAQGWLETFPMWDWVGGRTSVMSAVGLLPAALQGIDIDSFLAGARAMDRATREPNAARNPAMLLALAWHHATGGRGQKDMVVLPYCDRLELLSRYLQQLVMESLGKKHDLDGRVVNQGIAVYGNKGSTDQHAYVQQLRDGVPNFFVTFIQIAQEREGARFEVEPGVTSGDYLAGFLEGTRQALFEAERPSLTIGIRRVDARSLGMLIALFERAVGLYASLVNINAYHQPGVEAGKKAAADVLALQARVLSTLKAAGTSGATAAQIARDCGSQRVDLVWRILARLAMDGARGVQREGADGDLFAQRFRST